MKTLLCISSGFKLTMPDVKIRPEGFRHYYMAKPGERLSYPGGVHGEPERSKLDVPDVYHSPCGRSFPYGLIVVEDLRYMKDDLTMNQVLGDPMATYKPATIPAMELAADLLEKQSVYGWWNYGVVLLRGNEPEDVEIRQAIDQRLTFGHWRVNEAIKNYQEGQAGKGRHATYQICDAAQPTRDGGIGGWAWEMGKRLPNTWEALEKISDEVAKAPVETSARFANETFACPACFIDIDPRAKICRHCRSVFKTAVSELMPMVGAQEANQQARTLR